MRDVLKPGGTLLLDTRNWEKLRREQVRASMLNRVVERDGIPCIPIQLWDHQDWDAQHSIELLLTFEQRGQLTVRRCVLAYRRIRFEELYACMEAVGFYIHEHVLR
jgi:hypothetical protein